MVIVIVLISVLLCRRSVQLFVKQNSDNVLNE